MTVHASMFFKVAISSFMAFQYSSTNFPLMDSHQLGLSPLLVAECASRNEEWTYTTINSLAVPLYQQSFAAKVMYLANGLANYRSATTRIVLSNVNDFKAISPDRLMLWRYCLQFKRWHFLDNFSARWGMSWWPRVMANMSRLSFLYSYWITLNGSISFCHKYHNTNQDVDTVLLFHFDI